MTYYQLANSHGEIISGSRNAADIESRRASLIAENEIKLNCERTALKQMLCNAGSARRRAAVIGFFRPNMAHLKAELKHWHLAKVETRELCR